MKYEDFATQLMEKNGKWSIGLLNDLYEKRGDAYLRLGDYKRGALDFSRIYKGIPNFADSVDRWRALGKNTKGQYFLDVKSVDFSDRQSVRLRIKTVGKKE
jgi:hypothetical protein